jgi:AbrB family looped-hinge helix DNA binding protein
MQSLLLWNIFLPVKTEKYWSKIMPRIGTTKMSSKGQVVIPEDIRKQLKLKAGAQFIVVGEKDTVVLKTITQPPLDEFEYLLKYARRQARKVGLKRSEIKKAVAKVRGKK